MPAEGVENVLKNLPSDCESQTRLQPLQYLLLPPSHRASVVLFHRILQERRSDASAALWAVYMPSVLSASLYEPETKDERGPQSKVKYTRLGIYHGPQDEYAMCACQPDVCRPSSA